MLGWLLGLGLLGGSLWYIDKNIIGLGLSGNNPTAQDDRVTIRATQDLLAFFNRNGGITPSSANAEQNARVRAFQIAWSRTEIPKLRTDGIWDSTTANVFRELTGYSPPPVQAQVTSGYRPIG